MEKCKSCQKALKESSEPEYTEKSNSEQSRASFRSNLSIPHQTRAYRTQRDIDKHRVTITQCGHLFHTACIKKLGGKGIHNKNSVRCSVCMESVQVPTGLHPIKLHQGSGKLEKQVNFSKIEELNKKIDQIKKALIDSHDKKYILRNEVNHKEMELDAMNSSGILEKVKELRKSRTELEEKIRTLTSRNAQLIDYFEKQKLDKRNLVISLKGKIELETKKSTAITTLFQGKSSILNLTDFKEKSRVFIDIVLNKRQGKESIEKKPEKKVITGLPPVQWESKNVVTLFKKEKEILKASKTKKAIQVNSNTKEHKNPSKSKIPVLQRNCRTDVSKSDPNSSCTSFELLDFNLPKRTK